METGDSYFTSREDETDEQERLREEEELAVVEAERDALAEELDPNPPVRLDGFAFIDMDTAPALTPEKGKGKGKGKSRRVGGRRR
eukprot:SAG22_NODE_7623_length_722_cov_2.775281_1_plen_85_part_00